MQRKIRKGKIHAERLEARGPGGRNRIMRSEAINQRLENRAGLEL